MIAPLSTAEPLRELPISVVRDRRLLSRSANDRLAAHLIALLCEIEGLRAVEPLGLVSARLLPSALAVRQELVSAGVALPPSLSTGQS